MRLALGCLAAAWCIGLQLLWAQNGDRRLPPDFSDQLVAGQWPHLVGMVFDHANHLIAWSRDGRVFRSPDGQVPAAPILDLREEVSFYGDHGLLSVQLDPQFASNGRIYALYTVDRHHLFHFGTPSYDPQQDDLDYPTIGRVVRYTLDPADFSSVIPGSRRVLIGDSARDGIPILHKSHGLGALRFGTDGSLLVSAGDGASYVGTDVGGDEAEARATQALQEGIIEWYEDVGAFRAQTVPSLSGKIIRISPEDGSGYPSNPFYEAEQPQSDASKVWMLGLRNPFRFEVQPGTGLPDPAAGAPGVLLICDVGWSSWEEINVGTKRGENFGWPLYEGMEGPWQYVSTYLRNPLAPNPLAGQGDCNRSLFSFGELLATPQANGTPPLRNQCDTSQLLPDTLHQHVWTPPALAYPNIVWGANKTTTVVPTFDAQGFLQATDVTDLNSPVASDFFGGTCVIGAAFVSDSTWPHAYRNTWLIGDLTGWIRSFSFTEGSNQLRQVHPFLQDTGFQLLSPRMHPQDGCLWYIRYGRDSEIRKICFGGNPPPLAQIRVDTFYGPSPLTVQFSAAGSTDPEGQPLRYEWDFGDGSSSQAVAPQHTFMAEEGHMHTYLVRLRVTDSAGASDQRLRAIYLNNTPPQVRITGFADSARYAISGATTLPLRAEVSDAESPTSALRFEWLTSLYHNTHQHPAPVDTMRISQVTLDPVGCDGERYWYEVTLRVTDPGGMQAEQIHRLLPYCGTPLNVFADMEAVYQGRGVAISWRMDTEAPGTTFAVQRSADGLSFETVATLLAEGQDRYFWLDEAFQPAQNLYRIEALSPSGLRDYSPQATYRYVSLTAPRTFPNPARTHLWVAYPEQEAPLHYALFDPLGRPVRAGEWPVSETSQHRLSLRHLSSGVYLLRLQHGEEEHVLRCSVSVP